MLEEFAYKPTVPLKFPAKPATQQQQGEKESGVEGGTAAPEKEKMVTDDKQNEEGGEEEEEEEGGLQSSQEVRIQKIYDNCILAMHRCTKIYDYCHRAIFAVRFFPFSFFFSMGAQSFYLFC